MEAPISRSSDPPTSTDGASETSRKLFSLRLMFCTGVMKCGGSATANEAAAAMTEDHSLRESIRKRARECVEAGGVKVEEETRACSVSGKRCRVYSVVN